ncbi:MAG: MBOAT family protein [Lachnospiraceae bacterium]|nr:MBOAT family protein [Lachnospiraceae bacterium]
MVFSSLTFLFLFLPVCLLTYFLIPAKYVLARKYVLTAFSIVFYACGEPVYVFLIAASVSITYFLSKQIEKKNKYVFILALILILFPLGFFKYSNFVIDNINKFAHLNISHISLVMPIGISFYTFQILTYVIDLYKGQVRRQNNIGLLTLYIFFFPQLIAGPIVKYVDIEQALGTSNEDWDKIKEGTKRFLVGLSKKVIIANQIGYIVDSITGMDFSRVSTQTMWLASISFTIQLYFDFSGYSDMAIGLGKIFGFEFKENFNSPYLSLSVSDFWRRWHISMGSFFREYIYIPLGGNRKGKLRWIINILIVWAVTGLWHGANWSFVAWGLYYAFLLILEKVFLGKILKNIPKFISWVYTFFLTIVGWTLFMWDTNSPRYLISRVLRLFTQEKSAFPFPFTVSMLELDANIIYLLLGFIIATPIGSWIASQIKKLMKPCITNSNWYCFVHDMVFVSLFVICIVFLVGETFNPFIYFRF